MAWVTPFTFKFTFTLYGSLLYGCDGGGWPVEVVVEEISGLLTDRWGVKTGKRNKLARGGAMVSLTGT